MRCFILKHPNIFPWETFLCGILFWSTLFILQPASVFAGENRVEEELFSPPRGVLVGGGLGLAIPWLGASAYVESEVQRDFRLNPEPGYYPYLQERTSELAGSLFFLAVTFDTLEIRYALHRFGWDQAIVTHVSNTRLDVVSNQFDDATASFIPVDDAAAASIRSEMEGELVRDISDLDLAKLDLHLISFGQRYYVWQTQEIGLWFPWAAGGVLATFTDPDAEINLGLFGAGGVGVSYEVSTLIGFEIEARYQGMITQAPGDYQQNLNHAEKTGGWVGSAIFEVFHFGEVQVGLRLNIP